MATRKLNRIQELPLHIVNKLSLRSITTVKELLETPAIDLSELLDVSLAEAEETVRVVSRNICPQATTVAELCARQAVGAHHLAMTLGPLDVALHGGLPVGGITELVGPAGVGKTQLCKQLTICATLPVLQGGLGGTVIYIDTESKFSASRLVEMAKLRFAERFSNPEAVDRLAHSVVVLTPTSTAELIKIIGDLQGTIIDRGAKLVVIDSIAALARMEFSRDQLVERQQVLGAQAARLKQVAEAFRIPVLVTNQVTTRFGSGPQNQQQQQGPSRGGGADSHLGAALGTKWAHCVNTRLLLQVYPDNSRTVLIAKSPASPSLQFPYEVSASGVQLVGAGTDVKGPTADLAIQSAGGGAAALQGGGEFRMQASQQQRQQQQQRPPPEQQQQWHHPQQQQHQPWQQQHGGSSGPQGGWATGPDGRQLHAQQHERMGQQDAGAGPPGHNQGGGAGWAVGQPRPAHEGSTWSAGGGGGGQQGRQQPPAADEWGGRRGSDGRPPPHGGGGGVAAIGGWTGGGGGGDGRSWRGGGGSAGPGGC